MFWYVPATLAVSLILLSAATCYGFWGERMTNGAWIMNGSMSLVCGLLANVSGVIVVTLGALYVHMIVSEFLLSCLPPLHDPLSRVVRNGVIDTDSCIQSPARLRMMSALGFLANTFAAACCIYLGGSVLGHVAAYITDHVAMLIVNHLCLFSAISLGLATVIWMLVTTHGELHTIPKQSNVKTLQHKHLSPVPSLQLLFPHQELILQQSTMPITTTFDSSDPSHIPPLPKFVSSKQILTLHRAVGASTARSFSASTNNDLKSSHTRPQNTTSPSIANNLQIDDYSESSDNAVVVSDNVNISYTCENDTKAVNISVKSTENAADIIVPTWVSIPWSIYVLCILSVAVLAANVLTAIWMVSSKQTYSPRSIDIDSTLVIIQWFSLLYLFAMATARRTTNYL